MRHAARRLVRRLGYDVHRHRPLLASYDGGDFPYRRNRLLRGRGIELVLDVGANEGQYARELRGSGYEAKIISFEPVRGPYAVLERHAAGDPLWDCRRLALSDADGEEPIHVCADSKFSSFLELRNTPGDGYGSPVVDTETVPTLRLDAIAGELLVADLLVWMKLDVQGYERRVLRGAAATLARLDAVELELSVSPHYEGQSSYREALDVLEAEGFVLAGIDSGFTDASTGRMLELEAILVRP
jgi:FkbM family methyltransferase